MGVPRDIQTEVDNLIFKLKRRQIVGSHNVALATALLMRHVISRWSQSGTLIAGIKDVGKRLVTACPSELVVGNIVRRVLHIIREEIHNLATQDNEDEGLLTPTASHSRSYSFLASTSQLHSPIHQQHGLLSYLSDGEQSRPRSEADSEELPSHLLNANVKPLVIDGVKELIEELEHIHSNIASQSYEHIHSNEIILTMGKSRTVEAFLKHAAKTRRFQVMVAETAPEYSGQDLAVSLSSAGIDTTLIPDTAIFAIMSRVNKVILGCHAVTANGGLIAASGSHIVATAAKYHSTPVVVCTGMYKLSPIYPYDTDAFNTIAGPEKVLDFEEGDILSKVDVVNPYYDFVTPDLVSLFITNVGPHPPTFIHRVVAEQYSQEDITRDELKHEGLQSK